MTMPPKMQTARNDEAGDGVALDELHGAVHGAVELRLASQSGAARARIGETDGARTHVGVDAHLLAGHGVEGEAGADLRDPLAPLVVAQEVDRHQDEEDDDADDEVAAQAGETADDVAGRGRSLFGLARRG